MPADMNDDLKAKVGGSGIDHMIGIWDKMIIVLERAELHPTHLRAQRPL